MLELKNGIHFYINIDNYEEIIENEEKSLNRLTHSIHLTNSFFSSIERYASKYHDFIQIEKITGSRIHLYAIGEIKEIADKVLDTIGFAYKFSLKINNVAKYKSLLPAVISCGAAYGKYFIHNFKRGLFEEITSIGYACNYAAKLQSVSNRGWLSIDKDIYDVIGNINYKELSNDAFRTKYHQEHYYSCPLRTIVEEDYSSFIEGEISFHNNHPLGDIDFTDTNSRLNFDSLSLNNCRRFNGMPFFADVRDFTSKFDEDDKNLMEMAQKVIHILETMYNTIDANEGTHVQFQGDREFAVFVLDNEGKYLKKMVIAGLRMIDRINEDVGFSLGIGSSIGRLYATRAGMRGSKDNILIGSTVNDANYVEDEVAGKKELVITAELFNKLLVIDKDLAKLFDKKREGYYFTTTGYTAYRRIIEKKEQEKETQQHRYNGAWRPND